MTLPPQLPSKFLLLRTLLPPEMVATALAPARLGFVCVCVVCWSNEKVCPAIIARRTGNEKRCLSRQAGGSAMIYIQGGWNYGIRLRGIMRIRSGKNLLDAQVIMGFFRKPPQPILPLHRCANTHANTGEQREGRVKGGERKKGLALLYNTKSCPSKK
jgi:hypothetical protein